MFGRYRMMKRIGHGISGVTYLAEHIKLKSLRVVKCVKKNHIMYEQFLKEATLLKSLKHPGIPIIFDLEEDNEYLYIIEEYIEGQSLQAKVLNQTNISLDTIIDYGIQICNIFVYLHHFEPVPILYLDLKPSHIIVCNQNIKIIDFGTAIFMEKENSLHYSLGTPNFAAPEQLDGLFLNQKTDIYAIGTILYFMATGKVPDIEKDISSMMKHLEQYPIMYQQIIQICLEKDHQNRFHDVTELKNKLLTLQQRKSSLIIAVTGSQSRIGTTHIAMSLTAFFNERGILCLYEEKNSSGAVQKLKEHDDSMKERDGFYYKENFIGIPVYGQAVHLDKSQFSVFVQDYGYLTKDLCEIKNAEIIIGVVGAKAWELENTELFLDAFMDFPIVPIINYMEKGEAKKVLPYLPIKKVYLMPESRNLFKPSNLASRLFLKLFLKETVSQKRGGAIEKLKKRKPYFKNNWFIRV